MGAKGVISFMTIIVLLFPLAEAVVSEKDHQLPLDNRINLEETMDEDTAELLWVNCGAELIYSMEAFQDLQYCGSGSDKTLLGKERIMKAINVQDPHVKETIQDCLRDKSIAFSESRKDEHNRKWYMEYIESFVHRRNDAPGRRRLAEASASHGTVIVAVVVTAVVTLCLAALLFYCYIRTFGTGGIQNDEKPLLSLSLSASQKSSQGQDGKGDNQSNNQKKDSSLDGVSVDSGATGIPPLKPPPGRDASSLNPPPRVKSSLRHTLKPRAVRAESSLRPVGKTESSLRTAAERTELSLRNIVGKTESSLRSVAGKTESSLRTTAGKADSYLRPTAGSTEPSLRSSPGATESSVRTPPGGNGAAPPPSPAAAPPPPSPPALATSPRPPSAGPTSPTSPHGAPPPPGPPPPPRGAAPPPPGPGGNAGPPPPPPPRGGAAQPRPPGGGIRPPRRADQADASKAKLKPFFWDKVMARPDQAMVWHKIKSGSFQFNEEMIESLFGYQAPDKNKDETNKNSSRQEPAVQFIQIIDPKKAQNLSILLKALNVTTEEVCAALKEGNELPVELVQTLLKMAPTGEEELKLRLYGGDLNRLGPAERFLKVLVEIPFAFKRLESLLFMCTLQEEETIIKESFHTLEAACVELKKSRLFLKLLEAVLKTGNRMNVGTFRGSAQAFKLDTLLKLSDVKGVDGKTTLLHFVVQEIIRSEGIRAVRAAKDNKSFSSVKTEDLVHESSSEESEEHYCNLGLQVVSGLSNELENVKKAAIIDADGLTNSVSRLGHGLVKARQSLNTDMNLEDTTEDEEADEFRFILSNFVESAEKDITWMLEEEKRIMSLVKSTADYFHGNSAKDEGLRLFTIVRDFLIILDKVCIEIKSAPIKPPKTKKDVPPETQKNDDSQPSRDPQKSDDHQYKIGSPTESHQSFSRDEHRQVAPAIIQKQLHGSSSSEEDD